jgi:hypothetical protein
MNQAVIAQRTFARERVDQANAALDQKLKLLAEARGRCHAALAEERQLASATETDCSAEEAVYLAAAAVSDAANVLELAAADVHSAASTVAMAAEFWRQASHMVWQECLMS